MEEQTTKNCNDCPPTTAPLVEPPQVSQQNLKRLREESDDDDSSLDEEVERQLKEASQQLISKVAMDHTRRLTEIRKGTPKPPKPRKKRTTPPVRVPWEDRMKDLRQYQAEHGNLLIPIRYKRNPSLGKFVHNMREQYKLFQGTAKTGYKKRCSLTKERIDELESLGFVWKTNRTQRQNDDWNLRLDQLKKYKETHGHCNIPHGYPENPSLAEWVHRQRTIHRSIVQNKTNVTETTMQRMQQLHAVGFCFAVHSAQWMEFWVALKHFQQEFGHCDVPAHYDKNPRLGRWTHAQRHQRKLLFAGKKSSITLERVQLLDELEFSWEIKGTADKPRITWQQRFSEMDRFQVDHGHFLVEDPDLYQWCALQRKRLQKMAANEQSSYKLPASRVQLLHSIGFTKDVILSKEEAAVEEEPKKSQA